MCICNNTFVSHLRRYALLQFSLTRSLPSITTKFLACCASGVVGDIDGDTKAVDRGVRQGGINCGGQELCFAIVVLVLRAPFQHCSSVASRRAEPFISRGVSQVQAFSGPAVVSSTLYRLTYIPSNKFIETFENICIYVGDVRIRGAWPKMVQAVVTHILGVDTQAQADLI